MNPSPYLTPNQAFERAVDLHVAGHLDEAERIYRHLLTFDGQNPELLHLLGLLLFGRGHLAPAIALMKQSATLTPGVARYQNNLGTALIDAGCFLEAISVLETATRLDPNLAPAHYNLGNAYSRERRWDEAVQSYQRTLALQPDYSAALLNMGNAMAAAGRLDEAIALYQNALATQPPSAALATNLGNLLRDRSDLDAAIAAYKYSLELSPDDPVTVGNLGNAFKDQGATPQAIAAFRRCIELKPDFPEAHSNLVFSLYFEPTISAAEIEAELRAWDEAHARPLRRDWQPHTQSREPMRRLRVGYVSPDFRDHVVGRTLLPVFEHHDREQVEIFCYSGATPDHVTERFRARSDHWRDLNQINDEKTAAMIREDRIDVLVDLSLHTAYHRLLTFARRPAPVQVSWLGYPGSTGLEAIDYHLTDRFLEAGSARGAFALPETWCTHARVDDAPPVNPLPAINNGHITFGSFNNFGKMNPSVWDLWLRILTQVPASRLVLLAKAGGHEERTRQLFRDKGIDPGRLEFLRYIPPALNRPHGEYLLRYHAVDIALDPFPYNGMTTTCDALWMGVPVVALIGDHPISRASFSLLSNVGVPELATASTDEYVRLAVDLANDLPRLANLRSTLRERMAASPLVDSKSLARHVEAAFREMWRRWCENPH